MPGPTLFNLIMITLVELAAVFWVGAQFWLNFVLPLSAEAHEEERPINAQVQQHFEQHFSLPTLLILLLANIGVLVGQALNLAGGNWAGTFSLPLLESLATSERFGTYWLMRGFIIVLMLLLSLSMLWRKQRPRSVNVLLPLANLVLGSTLFIAMTMSSPAAADSTNIVGSAVVIDWLHLLAAALWVGGMIYIATVYLPVLRRSSVVEQARSLITVLAYYSPLAVSGIVIMAVTGPFSATFHLSAWGQLLTTAYGRTLLVKMLLVGALLITSTLHLGLMRPYLRKEYKKYSYALDRLKAAQAGERAEQNHRRAMIAAQQVTQTSAEPGRTTKLIARQVRWRENRLTKGTERLTKMLCWEPFLGVAVLICVGLMNVFASTSSPTAAAQQRQQTIGKPQPFTTSVRTTDRKFMLTLTVNPNRFGTNVFTVSVADNSTGAPVTNIGVTLYTTMLDMDMGTHKINLLPDGKSHFSVTDDLSMAGDWQIRIQIRTPDATLHEASVELFTPF